MFGFDPALAISVLVNGFLAAISLFLVRYQFTQRRKASTAKQEIKKELEAEIEKVKNEYESFRDLESNLNLLIDNNPGIILETVDRIIFDVRTERKDGEAIGDAVDLLWMALLREADFEEMNRRLDFICELKETGKVTRQTFPSGAIKELQGIVNSYL